MNACVGLGRLRVVHCVALAFFEVLKYVSFFRILFKAER